MPRIRPRTDDERRSVRSFRLIPGTGIRKQAFTIQAIPISHTGFRFRQHSGKVSPAVFLQGNSLLDALQPDIHTVTLRRPHSERYAVRSHRRSEVEPPSLGFVIRYS